MGRHIQKHYGKTRWSHLFRATRFKAPSRNLEETHHQYLVHPSRLKSRTNEDQGEAKADPACLTTGPQKKNTTDHRIPVFCCTACLRRQSPKAQRTRRTKQLSQDGQQVVTPGRRHPAGFPIHKPTEFPCFSGFVLQKRSRPCRIGSGLHNSLWVEWRRKQSSRASVGDFLLASGTSKMLAGHIILIYIVLYRSLYSSIFIYKMLARHIIFQLPILRIFSEESWLDCKSSPPWPGSARSVPRAAHLNHVKGLARGKWTTRDNWSSGDLPLFMLSSGM